MTHSADRGVTVQESGVLLIKSNCAWQELLRQERPLVAMFTSRFCGVCRGMRRSFSAMRVHLPKDVILACVDVQTSDREISINALGEVAFVPAFQVYRSGQQVDYFMASDAEDLKEKLAGALSGEYLDEETMHKVGTPVPMGCFGALSSCCTWFVVSQDQRRGNSGASRPHAAHSRMFVRRYTV